MVLFSEYKTKMKDCNNGLTVENNSSNKIYTPITDGEVRFSNLFKIFAKDGTLPKDYVYDKVREYMVDLGIITMKDMGSNGVSKRISFVTDEALDKKILRIVGRNRCGDSFTYSYVFTVKRIEYMRKLFLDLMKIKSWSCLRT